MFRVSRPGAAGLNRASALSRTDGTQPLPWGVMSVTLRGRHRRQEEWYRKIIRNDDPVSL